MKAPYRLGTIRTGIQRDATRGTSVPSSKGVSCNRGIAEGRDRPAVVRRNLVMTATLLLIMTGLGSQALGQDRDTQMKRPAGSTGLIAHFPLDGHPHNTVGGDGVIVTVEGEPPDVVPGRFRQAYRFRGEAVIASPLDIDFATHPQVTITAWIKLPAERKESGGFLVSSGRKGSAPRLRLSNENLRAHAGRSMPVLYAEIAPETWTFVAGVWDFSTMTVRLHKGSASETFVRKSMDPARLSESRHQPRGVPPSDPDGAPKRYIFIGARDFNASGTAHNVAIDDVRVYAGAKGETFLARLRTARTAPSVANGSPPSPDSPGRSSSEESQAHSRRQLPAVQQARESRRRELRRQQPGGPRLPADQVKKRTTSGDQLGARGSNGANTFDEDEEVQMIRRRADGGATSREHLPGASEAAGASPGGAGTSMTRSDAELQAIRDGILDGDDSDDDDTDTRTPMERARDMARRQTEGLADAIDRNDVPIVPRLPDGSGTGPSDKGSRESAARGNGSRDARPPKVRLRKADAVIDLQRIHVNRTYEKRGGEPYILVYRFRGRLNDEENPPNIFVPADQVAFAYRDENWAHTDATHDVPAKIGRSTFNDLRPYELFGVVVAVFERQEWADLYRRGDDISRGIGLTVNSMLYDRWQRTMGTTKQYQYDNEGSGSLAIRNVHAALDRLREQFLTGLERAVRNAAANVGLPRGEERDWFVQVLPIFWINAPQADETALEPAKISERHNTPGVRPPGEYHRPLLMDHLGASARRLSPGTLDRIATEITAANYDWDLDIELARR